MVRKILVLSMLAVSLATPGAYAQPAAGECCRSGVDPGSQGHGYVPSDTEALSGVDRTDR